MKAVQIKDSYQYWDVLTMQILATIACLEQYGSRDVTAVLNRSWESIYIEWWLHNVGYYLTLPFIKHETINTLNKRFKDVDLEEWK